MRETVAQFGRGRALTGIVTSPSRQSEGGGLPDVILLGAGLMHRVGPGRLYVRLARELASMGVRTLRFDYSGVGDSRATDDDRPPTERFVAEVRSAMDFLTNAHGSTNFVLGGVCSGAGLGYLTSRADDRVTEIWLMNPPAPVLTRRYLRVLRSHPNRWRKIAQAIGHRFRASQKRTSDGEPSPPHDIVGELHSLVKRGVKVLIVTSEWDAGFDYLNGVLPRRLVARGVGSAVEVVPIPGADHLFRFGEHQAFLVNRIVKRVEEMRRSKVGGPPASTMARSATDALPMLTHRTETLIRLEFGAGSSPEAETGQRRGTSGDADFTSFPQGHPSR